MGLALLVAPCLAPRHFAPDDGKGFEPIFVQNLDLGELAPDGKSVGSISCAAWIHTQLPRCSMYGIFTYMYHKLRPNVGTYTVHGALGQVFFSSKSNSVRGVRWMYPRPKGTPSWEVPLEGGWGWKVSLVVRAEHEVFFNTKPARKRNNLQP